MSRRTSLVLNCPEEAHSETQGRPVGDWAWVGAGKVTAAGDVFRAAVANFQTARTTSWRPLFYRVGDKNALKWTVVMVVQLCDYTKNH